VTTVPFEPIGELPRWRAVFDLVAEVEYGATVPFSDLEPLFDGNRKLVYQAVIQANRHLREQLSKMLESVPGTGYRVLKPSEHVIAAEKRRRQARRRVDLAIDIASSTNRDVLTKPELERLDTVERAMGILIGHLRMQAKTLAKHDRIIQAHGEEIEKLKKQVKDKPE